MGTEASILESLSVSREEIFSVPSKEVVVFEKDQISGKVYYRNGHFGVTFAPASITDQYRGYE